MQLFLSVIPAAFLVAAPVLELRAREFVSDYIHVWARKRNTWDFSCFHLTQSQSHWFSKPEIVGTSLPSTGALGWGPGVGLGLLSPQGEPPQLRHPS